MYTIDYYRGRAEAAEEAHKLLQLIHSNDPRTLGQLEILSKYLLDIVECAVHDIDIELSIMESNELLRR